MSVDICHVFYLGTNLSTTWSCTAWERGLPPIPALLHSKIILFRKVFFKYLTNEGIVIPFFLFSVLTRWYCVYASSLFFYWKGLKSGIFPPFSSNYSALALYWIIGAERGKMQLLRPFKYGTAKANKEKKEHQFLPTPTHLFSLFLI